jgi:glutamyl-Q tRNA(Asp) synthetase
VHRLQDSGRNQGKTGQLIARAPSAVPSLAGAATQPTAYRGRFAPTPSGPLHLGSLLTALASYLDARAAGGHWLLRIDDLDTPRTKPGMTDLILRTLESLSLEWDEDVVYQSQNLAAYQEALDTLQDQGRIYACECTRRETTQLHASRDGSCPGQCRTAGHVFRAGENALRIRTPDSPWVFCDRIKGRIERSPHALSGDFILFRRDNVYAYHLATVVDDHRAGITHVVRGQDLLDSTPQQIFLQQALGYSTPIYTHTPLMITPDGRKLSKSEGAPPLDPDQGGRVIRYLLKQLGIEATEPLTGMSPKELLGWAIPQWNLGALQGAPSLVIEDNRIPA